MSIRRILSFRRDPSSLLALLVGLLLGLVSAASTHAAQPITTNDEFFVTGQRQAVDVLANDRESQGVLLSIEIASLGTCGTSAILSVENDLLIYEPIVPSAGTTCSMSYRAVPEVGTKSLNTTVIFQVVPVFEDGFESGNASKWSECAGSGC